MSKFTLFSSQRHKNYQVLIGGGGFTLFMYGAFFIMKRSGVDLPIWIWYIGLPIVIVGFLLDLFTNRLRTIYFYLTFVHLLTGIANAIAFFYIERRLNDGVMSHLVRLAGIVAFFIVIWMSYSDASRRERQKQMLVPLGKLDTDTGIVHTAQQANYASNPTQTATEQSNGTRKYTPFLIGSGLFVIRTYGAPAESIFFLLFTLIFSSLSAIISGGVIYYLSAVIRWEHQHHKSLRVKP